MRRFFAACSLALAFAAVAAAQVPRFRPARFIDGQLIAPSPLTVGGGEVFLELTVTRDGAVSDVRPLRTTPPFAEALAQAVRGWKFVPAEKRIDSRDPRQEAASQPIASKVLVAAIVRPPAINGPTLGEQPQNVAEASEETPMPMRVMTPEFPPRARDSGAVLIEAVVGVDGRTEQAAVVRSSPAFDRSALDAARAWRYRPARGDGGAIRATAYLLFIFRTPIVGGTP